MIFRTLKLMILALILSMTGEFAIAQATIDEKIATIEAKLGEKMDEHNVPGVSLAVIQNGRLYLAKGYGVEQVGKSDPITTEHLFSVGSISKVVTAIQSLQLVEKGEVNLDEDINTYLDRWKVPSNEFTDEQPVTLRAIMSHTAGLTVHGFADFYPGEKQPTIVQVLSGSGPAKNSAVYVDIPVGSRFRYSGGGTTVSQLMIEEAYDMTLDESAKKHVFEPLGMNRSTYLNPIPASYEPIAKAHNGNGEAVALPRGYESMPENGASGLWTTPSELALALIDLYKAYNNQEAKLLGNAIVQEMAKPVSPSEYGLGPRIENHNGDLVINHGGSNNSYRSLFRMNLDTGNGYVIFTNGQNGNRVNGQLSDDLNKLLHN